MAVNWFTDTTTTFPYIYSAILERLRLYFCDLFYYQEEFEIAKKRFLLGNIEVGDEIGIRASIEKFGKMSQGKFPFTVWNMDDDEDLPQKSLYQANMKYFDTVLNINMVSFFNTPQDYYVATAKLERDLDTLTRLRVPIEINGQLTDFPIDLDMDVTKGGLAWQFMEYLRVGKIYNIVHNCKVKFHYFTLVMPSTYSTSGQQEAPTVNEVDDMVFALRDLETKALKEEITVNTIPNVSSSVPVDGASGVLTTSNIVLNFNTAMNEDSVLGNIDLVPSTSYRASFNSTSTQLTLEPFSEWVSGTVYNLVLNTNATSYITHPLEEDFELEFTTV